MRWALLALLGLSLFAEAGPVELTCTLPTLNTDGTPLTDLQGIKFYESAVSGGPYVLVDDQPVCLSNLTRTAGTYYFVSTAYNVAGTESDYSNEASKTVPASVPSPPAGLTVTGSLLAYGISQSQDVLTVYAVGNVPLSTPCNVNMTVNGLYQVPTAAVAWVGTVRPPVVFATCG